MPNFRQNRLRPIHTQKQENTWSNLSQNASTTVTITIAKGVDQADVSANNEVSIGSHVRFIYLEFHFAAETVTSAKVIHWTVRKLPFGTTATIPRTYNQKDKRFIFKRGMEMLPKDVSTVFKRIIGVRIPPKFSRIGEDDTLVLQYVCSSSETINACGISIIKSID